MTADWRSNSTHTKYGPGRYGLWEIGKKLFRGRLHIPPFPKAYYWMSRKFFPLACLRKKSVQIVTICRGKGILHAPYFLEDLVPHNELAAIFNRFFHFHSP